MDQISQTPDHAGHPGRTATTTPDAPPGRRRPPLSRRWLFGAGGAAGGLALAAVTGGRADAGAVTAPWRLGGNSDIATDGTNFLGPTVVAPLIFKTRRTATTPVTERMRIAPDGRILMGNAASGPVLTVTSKTGPAVTATCTDTSGTGTGVSADGYQYGVLAHSSNGYAVSAESDAIGAYARGAYGTYSSGSSFGVYGIGDLTGGGAGYGVLGTGLVGCYGSGSTYGVWGRNFSSSSDAVRGDGGQYGVRGVNGSTAGVRGESGYAGTWGEAVRYGSIGIATDTSAACYGAYGSAPSNGYAGYFSGNVAVFGTLSKSAGSFKIDHPLDPERRWLSHSFVESPDMMNVYNGNVVLGAGGRATVTLPDYFMALNTDFRYQLTCIGGSAPVYIAQKVTDGTFAIAGGTAGLEVSWQVTGIRQDDYAKAHPIVVDQAKPKDQQGTRSFAPAGSRARVFDGAPAFVKDKAGPAHPAVVDPDTLRRQVAAGTLQR